MAIKPLRALFGSTLVVALAIAASRLSGVALELPGGKAVGYSELSAEWLFAEYPSEPLRRDGPYVMSGEAGRYTLTLEPQADGGIAVARTRTGAEVEVVADQSLGRGALAPAPIRFRVPLRIEHPRAPTQWPMPGKMLVVSDLEGEFAAAVRLLRAQGVIDDRLSWTYGDGHLVLIGDMVDRGIDVVPLLWLIYKLEAEARAAGGAVHYLLGNHERYVLQGRPKSAHPKHLATSRATGLDYGHLWSSHSELGRWLRSKPVMVKVGDTLFAHGGVSADLLALAPDLARIDAAAARYTDAVDDDAREAVIVTGPMSDRSLAMASENGAARDKHLTRLLRHFGASRIAIGHTSVPHVGYTHQGRILRTNVAHARGVNEAILWSEARWWRCDVGGRRAPLGPTFTSRKR